MSTHIDMDVDTNMQTDTDIDVDVEKDVENYRWFVTIHDKYPNSYTVYFFQVTKKIY